MVGAVKRRLRDMLDKAGALELLTRMLSTPRV